MVFISLPLALNFFGRAFHYEDSFVECTDDASVLKSLIHNSVADDAFSPPPLPADNESDDNSDPFVPCEEERDARKKSTVSPVTFDKQVSKTDE